MDDYDFEDLSNEKMVYTVISTCGQGEYPGNSQHFMHDLSSRSDVDLKGVKFAVFGLGDDSYVHFNKAAKDVQEHFHRLGAEEVSHIGLGNDKDDDKWESEYNEWYPEVFTDNELPPPPATLTAPTYSVNVVSGAQPDMDRWTPVGTKLIPMTESLLTSDPRNEGYDRDIRHYVFDIADTNWQYSLGDCLAIYPSNNDE